MKINQYKILAGIFMLALGVGMAGYWYFDRAQPLQVVATNKAPSSADSLVGGTYTLINHRGEKVEHSDFHGRYQLIYFGFTHCSSICPVNLSEIARAIDILGPLGDEITPIFITTDPGSDTVETLSKYIPLFGDRMVGLTGGFDQVYQALDNYRDFFKKIATNETSDLANFDHSSQIFLMDRNGRYLAHFKDGEAATRIADTTYRMMRMLEPSRTMPQIELDGKTENAS